MDPSATEPHSVRRRPTPATGWRGVWKPDRWTALAAAVVLAHVLSFPVRTHPIATDVRYYLYYSAELAHGRVLYRDTFDPKGPFAPMVGAALYRLAEAIGTDPLFTIRYGFLGLTGLTAVAAFLLHRFLVGGRAGPAFVGLAAYLGMSLVTLLPTIGNICKLGLQLGCALAALFVAQRAWVLAGIAAGVAALDWQIGAIAVVAVLATALAFEREARLGAVARVALGVVIALAPLAAYFAWNHASGDALRATWEAAFVQHTSGWAKRGFTAEAARRWQLVSAGCAGHRWLVAAGLAGIPAFALGMVRWRHETSRLAPALAIGICHFALIALSAWELQGFGDLFALAHSLAFLAGIALIWLGTTIVARLSPAPRGPLAAPATFAILALLAARPWQPRADVQLATPAVKLGVTLDEQGAVAREVALRIGTRRAAFLGPSEIPFLLGIDNAVPFTIWHASAHAFYARPGEESAETLLRLLRDARAELLVTDHGVPPLAPRDTTYVRLDSVGDPDRYAVDVYRVP